MTYLGDFSVNGTVELKWSTNAANGASITRATNGSIRLYKGSSAVERASAAGITDTEDFDALTGVHHLKIDLSDNTDAGFYASGSEYQVVLAAATIDGQVVNAVLGHFSVERYGNVYGARVAMVDDNAGTTDRYTVLYMKNGQPLTAGITSPTIQVVAASDGAALIAEIALTQIASTGRYRHNATGAARVASGAAYFATITATIDGAVRTIHTNVMIGRDSA